MSTPENDLVEQEHSEPEVKEEDVREETESEETEDGENQAEEPEEEEKPEQKTFTQEELEKIISNRLKRERKKFDQLEGELNKIKTEFAPKQETKTRDDFFTDKEYEDYRLDQKVQERLSEYERNQREQASKQQRQQQTLESWNGRVQSYIAENPTYSEDIQNAGSEVEQEEVAEYILSRDDGPKVLHTLAKGDMIDRVNKMPPASAIALIEMMGIMTANESKAPAKKVSKAPAPIEKPSAGKRLTADSDVDSYVKARRKELNQR